MTSLSRSFSLTSVGRYVYTSLLERLVHGEVTLVDSDGQKRVFGERGAELRSCVTVRNDQFYYRLVISADIGFAEAYMLGEVDIDDLTNMIKIYILNREYLNNLTVSTAALSNVVHYLAHTRLAKNTINNTMSNISAHYDLGNELFSSFLDQTMMYSSAVWQKPDETLFDAQMRKVNMMIEKARLQSSDHLLEIGTGWGTLAIEAVKQTGCTVTTVTLSKEQKQLAEERIAKLPADQASKITVLLCDYRKLPEMFPSGFHFDKIISIEMIEAVGPEFLSTYFSVCHRMLHPQHGIMVLQCITMPESRYESYKKGADFIQRFIFPGGHCPTVTALTNAIHEGSEGGQLLVDNLENIGPHYAKTLRVWREKFLENFDSQLKPFPKTTKRKAVGGGLKSIVYSLIGLSNNSNDDNETVPFYSEEFKRKWLYYLGYCEAGFATRTLGNVQMVLTRECNTRMLEGVEQIVL